MPTYTAPGVYVEEVPSSQKVLSAAPTAIAAFVGFTERAPADDPNDPNGRARSVSLRKDELESRFPGLLDSVLDPARTPER